MNLDTRPAEMQSSTPHLWVHECTACWSMDTFSYE